MKLEEILRAITEVFEPGFCYEEEHVLNRVSLRIPFYNEGERVLNILDSSSIRPFSIKIDGNYFIVDWYVKDKLIIANKGEEFELMQSLFRYVESLGLKGNVKTFEYLFDVTPLQDNSQDYLKECVINPRFTKENFNYSNKITLVYSDKE